MLQKIVSSTLNHSLIDLAWAEDIDWVENNLGRLEMKFQMDGLEYLDLNTCVGWLSLRKMDLASVSVFRVLPLRMRGGGGVYVGIP